MIRRFIRLLLLGIVLTPLAAYVGGAVLPQFVAVWVALMFLKAITTQFAEAAKVLVAPAIYGSLWVWPVTCVILPVAGTLLRPGTRGTGIAMCAIGAIAGAATAFGLASQGFQGFNPNDAAWFALGGLAAGGASGAVFGLVLSRADSPPQAQPHA